MSGHGWARVFTPVILKSSSPMKIKYFTRATILFLFSVASLPAIANSPSTLESRAVHLQYRLEEIKSINRSTLSKDEKRTLRREVREIKKELAEISGGVYLSVGAIILVALLLILLL